MNRYAAFFEERDDESGKHAGLGKTPGFNQILLPSPSVHRAHSASHNEDASGAIKNNSHLGEKNLDMTQSENLSLQNSNSYKRKWVLSRMIKMQINIMYCKRVMTDIDCEKLSKEEYLEVISEKVLDFQEKIEKKIEEHRFKKQRSKNSSRRRAAPKLASRIREPQLSIEIAEVKNIQISVEEHLITCPICYGDNKPSNCSMIPACGHSFCKVCLAAYFHDRIINSNLEEIKCPQEGCLVKLRQGDLVNLLSESMFKKYEEFKEKYRLRRDPNVRWCSKAGCDGYMIINKFLVSFVRCSKCGEETCTNCRGPWHPGQTCEQVIDNELENYEKQVPVQKCPKCVCRIEKNGGCNHIVCSNCFHEFCWLCRKTYTQRHYRWWNICGCPGRQFIDEEERNNYNIICLLWCEDFLSALWFFLKFVGELLFNVIFGFPIYIMACIFAPISIYNEMYSDKELECWEEMLVYPALLITGLIAFPFVFLIGLWILIKRFREDEEISLFTMFYEEL